MLASRFSSTPFCCLWKSGNWDRRIPYFRCVQSFRRPMTRYCDCFLPRKHCKIENRRNHGPNLKIINRREKSIDASGDVLFKKYWKYADYANSATFTNYALFSKLIVPKIMQAQSLRADRKTLWYYIRTENVTELAFGTGRNHMFPYFWNVAETCNSMFPLCLRKSGPVPLYTQQRKREKTSRNR